MFGIGDIDSELKLMSGNILNMIVFDKFKTGKPVIDAFITTVILTGVTYLFQFINNNFLENRIDFTVALKQIKGNCTKY